MVADIIPFDRAIRLSLLSERARARGDFASAGALLLEAWVAFDAPGNEPANSGVILGESAEHPLAA